MEKKLHHLYLFVNYKLLLNTGFIFLCVRVCLKYQLENFARYNVYYCRVYVEHYTYIYVRAESVLMQD